MTFIGTKMIYNNKNRKNLFHKYLHFRLIIHPRIFMFAIIIGFINDFPVWSEIKQDTLITRRTFQTTQIISDAPRIDGFLNDPCWEEGNWSGDFVQRTPKSGAVASQNTIFKILYDDRNLYIAFKCFETEPDKIERQIGKRDQLKGDAVGIAFDSYYDQRTAFEFDVTAAGGKVDMIGTDNGQSWNFNWDAVWYAKTALFDSGWTAEIQVPFNQLRFSDKDEQIWGLHVTRRIYRFAEEDNWQLIPVDAPGMIHLFGELKGIKGISKKAHIELLPYTVGKIKFSKKETGNPFATGVDKTISAGFDAKVGLSSNFTLDMTVNPDFGQVEADPSELNLTVYETIFEERRPFFIEGRNLLEFNTNAGSLFYSRRIGSPPRYNPLIEESEFSTKPAETSILSAAKITGKTQNGLSLGILQCLTANEYATIRNINDDERHVKTQPLTSYSVAQIQKDFSRGNTVVGGIITSTNRIFDEPQFNFLNKNAYTGGFNILHQWHEKTYYVKFSGSGSYIGGDTSAMIETQRSPVRYFQRPDNKYMSVDSSLESMAGTCGELLIGKRGNGRFTYYERFGWSSPMFETNDLGYLSKSDFIDQKTAFSYKVNDPKNFYVKYSLFTEQVFRWDFSGKNQVNWVEINGSILLSNYWGGSGGIVYQYGINDPRILRGGPSMKLPSFYNPYFNVYSDQRKKFSGQFNYVGNLYNDGLSKTGNYKLSNTWIAGHAITIGSALTYQPGIIDYYYVTTTGNKYIMGKLKRETAYLTLRIGVYITPEVSIQYYGNPYFSVGKYSNFRKVIDPNADNYRDRFYYYSDDEINFNSISNKLEINDLNDNTSFSFTNPDFQFRELHSNLVFRWEFRPSSNLYLVWTHGRSRYNNVSGGSLSSTASGLFDIYPENVFLIKLNYWFPL